MEEAQTREIETEELAAPNGSLASRMAERADYLEKHQSDWFGVPGYDDLIEVELRALGWSTIRKIQERNQRIKDDATRELYNLADNIITATMGFREITDDGHRELQDDWIALARRAHTPQRPAPDDLTPRKAILYLVGDKRLPFLAQEWGNWSATIRKGVDEDVTRDFTKTGSSS